MADSLTELTERIAERELGRALDRIGMLNDLVCEAAERLEQQDPHYARALRHRAFDAAFSTGNGPKGLSW